MRSIQLVLSAVVACFILATIVISFLIFERQSTLQKVSRYDISFSVNQAFSEFMRLQQRVADVGIPGRSVDLEDIRLRTDILFGRLNLLNVGETGNFVRQTPERLETVRMLGAALDATEPLIDYIGEPGVVRRILSNLAPLDSGMASLASAASQFGEQRVAEDQNDLLRLHLYQSSVAFGLIVCGIALIILLVGNNRLLGRAQRKSDALAATLEQSSSALRVQNTRFDAALSNMLHALCMFDETGALVVGNRKFFEMSGLSEDAQRPGASLASLIGQGSTRGSASPLAELLCRQAGLVRDGRSSLFVHELGDGRALGVSHQALANGGWIATYEDITERRRAETKIAHMAHFDSLTDLANRVEFRHRLEQAMAIAKKDGSFLSVLSLDLDHFKSVNDTRGHHVGDLLLKAVADRLRSNIRDDDVVARLGGDEFAVLLTSMNGAEECGDLASRLIEAVEYPYAFDGQEVVIGLSIGIAALTDELSEPGQLMKQADLALYQAKATGRGTSRFFEPELAKQSDERKALETDLRVALSNGELEVFYQPLVHASTSDISGFEALLRWHHPTRGMVSPAQFIPIAETSGLIVPIGEWVLRQACAQAALWPPKWRLAVNLSAVQFRGGSMVQTVFNALASSGLQSHRLELEITETVLLDDNDQNLETLHQLRALGVRIAMDDFGTGYSSLGYLRSFPFDNIKIDQSFVRDLETRHDSLAIVKLVTGLAEALGMTTTAEGVETQEQFLQLQSAGCTEVQGYYFGRPKPPSEIDLSLLGVNGYVRERISDEIRVTARPARASRRISPPGRASALRP